MRTVASLIQEAASLSLAGIREDDNDDRLRELAHRASRLMFDAAGRDPRDGGGLLCPPFLRKMVPLVIDLPEVNRVGNPDRLALSLADITLSIHDARGGDIPNATHLGAVI
jgi:hypothetical protein